VLAEMASLTQEQRRRVLEHAEKGTPCKPGKHPESGDFRAAKGRLVDSSAF
jgi:hypothetical protein